MEKTRTRNRAGVGPQSCRSCGAASSTRTSPRRGANESQSCGRESCQQTLRIHMPRFATKRSSSSSAYPPHGGGGRLSAVRCALKHAPVPTGLVGDRRPPSWLVRLRRRRRRRRRHTLLALSLLFAAIVVGSAPASGSPPDLTLSFDAEPAYSDWWSIQPGFKCPSGAVDQSATAKPVSAAFVRDDSPGNVRHGKYSARVVLNPGDYSSYSCEKEAALAITRLDEGEGEGEGRNRGGAGPGSCQSAGAAQTPGACCSSSRRTTSSGPPTACSTSTPPRGTACGSGSTPA
jgi:hypothetical protein